MVQTNCWRYYLSRTDLWKPEETYL